MATDDAQTTKVSYVALIAMLRDLQTKLDPFVDPNSEFRQALDRRLKDLPKDDENVQTIVQGLDHFRKMYNTFEHDIQVLQRADKADIKQIKEVQ